MKIMFHVFAYGGIALNFSKSQSLYEGRSSEFFQVPKLLLGAGGGGRREKLRIFPSPRDHMGGRSSEFFQVPEPIQGRSLEFFQVPKAK